MRLELVETQRYAVLSQRATRQRWFGRSVAAFTEYATSVDYGDEALRALMEPHLRKMRAARPTTDSSMTARILRYDADRYKLAEALRKIFENFLIYKDGRDSPAARNYANFLPCRTSVATDGRVEIKIDLAYNLFDCLLDAYDQAVYVEMANLNVQELVEGSEPGEVDTADFNIVPETVAYDAFAYANCDQDAVHEEMVCELMEFFKGPSDDYEVSTEKIGIDAAWTRKPRVRLMVDGSIGDL